MRILLVDPQDSPRYGPWSRQRWDLIVDMGKSSQWSADVWEKQYGSPVIRTDSYRQKIEDVRRVGEILSAGRGRLIDEEGIDWWDITNLMFVPEVLDLVALQRMASAIPLSTEVWATRRKGAARLLAILLGRELQVFGETGLGQVVGRVLHYVGLTQRFSAGQIKEIFFDKYDPGYRWRSRFPQRSRAFTEPVVLLPTAYRNVSRMAAAYARLLPNQRFLMTATRQNGKQFVVPDNVEIRDLAGYAVSPPSEGEIASLLERWIKVKEDFKSFSSLRVLSQAGLFESIPNWIRDGLSVRNAWREVLQREPVCAVLCGDDSNRYTRLPVMLAAKRNIPTIDFNHGALDGHCMLKELPCDVYMAKNEMERDYLVRVCCQPREKIMIAAPTFQSIGAVGEGKGAEKTSVVFFSEPYEVSGMRAEEVYRELLPRLCRLARERGRGVIVKLHPFESRSQRTRLLREILSPEDCQLIKIVDGPLTEELMAKAWFGMTVESTTALDCLQNGVTCFLCGWLALSPYEYPEQYARFGVGEVVETVEQISDIPRRLQEFRNRPANPAALYTTADPAMFEGWLTGGQRLIRQEQSDARAIS